MTIARLQALTRRLPRSARRDRQSGSSAACRLRRRGLLACRKGCSACCRGLFDITLLDAFLLREGFAQLPPRAPVNRCWPAAGRAWPSCSCAGRSCSPLPAQRPPRRQLDRRCRKSDETPCPLLGDDGLCLVYPFRPMTCRLHGLPNIDLSGEDFSTDSVHPPPRRPAQPCPPTILRWPFREAFSREISTAARLHPATDRHADRRGGHLHPAGAAGGLRVFRGRGSESARR
ncbi:MAG: hypothetical protein MZW92_43560 [Comamonadaceae bacterium]|nr:hypothetical protein [Comamonadaceae bacterium]